MLAVVLMAFKFSCPIDMFLDIPPLIDANIKKSSSRASRFLFGFHTNVSFEFIEICEQKSRAIKWQFRKINWGCPSPKKKNHNKRNDTEKTETHFSVTRSYRLRLNNRCEFIIELFRHAELQSWTWSNRRRLNVPAKYSQAESTTNKSYDVKSWWSAQFSHTCFPIVAQVELVVLLLHLF